MLYAVNLKDGSIAWKSEINFYGMYGLGENKLLLSYVDGKLFLTGNGITAYNATDGSMIYSRPSWHLNNNNFGRPTFRDGMVYSISIDLSRDPSSNSKFKHTLHANDIENGNEVWNAALPEIPFNYYPEIVIKGNELYAFFAGKLNAIDTHSGEALYQVPFVGQYLLPPFLIGDSGNIFALDGNGGVSFSPKGKLINWTKGGRYNYMASGKGAVYMRHLTRSEYEPGGNFVDEGFDAFDEKTGAILYGSEVRNCSYSLYNSELVSSMVITDSTLLFSCRNGIHGFKLGENGNLMRADPLWTLPGKIDSEADYFGAMAISDDYLVVFNRGGARTSEDKERKHKAISTYKFEKLVERADPIEFAAAFNIKPGEWGTSKPITVSGVNNPVSVKVVGGEYSINEGAFTNETGLAKNGDKIRVRAHASFLAGDKVKATLSLNDVAGTFEVQAADESIVPISATAEGSLKSKTIDVKLNIGQEFVGKGGAIYVLLSHNGALYAYTQKGWVQASMSNIPQYYRGTLNNTLIRATSGLDISSIKGANLYVGYGKHLEEMLSAKRYKLVYTVQD